MGAHSCQTTHHLCRLFQRIGKQRYRLKYLCTLQSLWRGEELKNWSSRKSKQNRFFFLLRKVRWLMEGCPRYRLSCFFFWPRCCQWKRSQWEGCHNWWSKSSKERYIQSLPSDLDKFVQRNSPGLISGWNWPQVWMCFGESFRKEKFCLMVGTISVLECTE